MGTKRRKQVDWVQESARGNEMMDSEDTRKNEKSERKCMYMKRTES